MCALSKVIEDSITCNDGKIRIARLMTTGLVVPAGSSFQVRCEEESSGKAYGQEQKDVGEQRDKQAYQIPDVQQKQYKARLAMIGRLAGTQSCDAGIRLGGTRIFQRLMCSCPMGQ